MTCKESTEKLLDWIEGELTPDEAAEMESHVAECAECAQEVEQLRTVLSTVVEPDVEPGEHYFEGFYPRLRERIEREVGFEPWTVKLWRALTHPALWLKPAVAALTLMLVSGGTLVATGVIDLPQEQQTAVAGVSKVRAKPYNTVSLHPQVIASMSGLNEDEFEELQTEIAKMIVPEGAMLVVNEPSPVVFAPSLHSLDEQEIDELAEALAEKQIDL